LNAAVFLCGLAAWGCDRRLKGRQAVLSLLVVPLAIGGLNNGQCNALIAGLLLLSHVALERERWPIAATLLTVPILFKGYPLALSLLFCLVEPRRLTPRLVGCVLIGAALPYLGRPADYVTEQYVTFFRRMAEDDRTGFELASGYRDLHMLLRLAGLPLDLGAYRSLELALGLTCGGIMIAGRTRGWDRPTALAAAFALGSCWMTLAGPATEANTYVLVAPVLALAVLTAPRRPGWRRWIVVTSFGLFTAGAAVPWFPGWFARPILATGIQPFAALLLTAHTAVECFTSLQNKHGRHPIGCRPSAWQFGRYFFASGLGRSASSSRTGA
jgi:hypothetical protein